MEYNGKKFSTEINNIHSILIFRKLHIFVERYVNLFIIRLIQINNGKFWNNTPFILRNDGKNWKLLDITSTDNLITSSSSNLHLETS